ncbi:hypothetical protein LZ554_008900 [Drepanopeziza brunnea f. sp. 'monogermtubi']|nr:hypothetical protein LZ554_008900 [Drepanopeziza brunnea f. sp. 'monogermtubi']
MQTVLALTAMAAVAFAGVAPHVARTVPPGCSTSYDGKFQVTVLNGSSVVTKRELAERASSDSCGKPGLLTSTLKNGILTDSEGRIGNIVSNRQFQYDPAPGQTGAVYTDGFSICSNGSLATKAGSTVFYSCKSGDFANLYDQSIAPYCLPVFIDVMPCGSSSPGATVSQQKDGQPTATGSVAPITQITDGQAQVPTSVPAITQINDGQVQAPTKAPPAPPAVTQIPDGQLQVPTAGIPITQISDGQVQVPTAVTSYRGPAVSQIPDGQLQSNVSTNATKPPMPISSSGNGLMAGSFMTLVMAVAAMLFL